MSTALIATPITDQPILEFTGEWAWLSNFHRGETPIRFEGLSYSTAEHAYQATRTLTRVSRQLVLETRTATEAIAFGRKLEIRPEWDELKVGVMTEIVSIKFSDQALRELLVSTGDREIVNGSWYEYPGLRFWGARLVGRPGEPETVRWEGDNTLGEVLMAVRETVR